MSKCINRVLLMKSDFIMALLVISPDCATRFNVSFLFHLVMQQGRGVVRMGAFRFYIVCFEKKWGIPADKTY
jgi:hypothetical protein